MGADFGPIADMDRLDALMDGLFKLIDRHGGELASLSKTKAEMDAENAALMARMKNQKNQLTSGMSKIMKAMMSKDSCNPRKLTSTSLKHSTSTTPTETAHSL